MPHFEGNTRASPETPKEINASDRYRQLENGRISWLDRARRMAALTLPNEMPPEGWSPTVKLPNPFNTMGANGVNTLASKMSLALFPPNVPHLGLEPGEEVRNEATPAQLAELETRLASIATKSLEVYSRIGVIAKGTQLIKQLIIAGNALIELDPELKTMLRIHRLDKFVVVRDGTGRVIEVVVQEPVHPSSLPQDIREQVRQQGGDQTDPKENIGDNEETWYQYTWAKWDHDKKRWYQTTQIGGVKVVEDSHYPDKKSPWLVATWAHIDGMPYSNGMDDQTFGDLVTAETLTKSLTSAGVQASRVIYLANPGGTTNYRVLSKAPNGSVISGKEGDITTVRLDKMADLQFAQQILSGVERSLTRSFHMVSSVQRDAERVTAEEIKTLAQELDRTLGGVYANHVVTLQKPLAERVVVSLGLPLDSLKITITTGLEALGKSVEVERLNQWMSAAFNVLGDQLPMKVNVQEYLRRLAVDSGIVNYDRLLVSPEEQQQSQQQAQMQQMMQKLGPDVIKAVTEASPEVVQQMTQQMMAQQGGPNVPQQ